MKHISKEDLDGLRARLEKERMDVVGTLAEHGKKVEGNWQGVAQGFDENAADETDEADKMEELATNVPLVETLEARLKDIDDALAKMAAGTYGLSEDGGEEISIERLRANPAARTNI